MFIEFFSYILKSLYNTHLRYTIKFKKFNSKLIKKHLQLILLLRYICNNNTIIIFTFLQYI